MKKFFKIESNKYIFEWADICTFLTIVNVALVLLGYWFAPIIGIINAVLGIALNIYFKSHINSYLTMIALIILNCYFLTL